MGSGFWESCRNGSDDLGVFALSSERYETGWLLSDTLAEYLDVFAPVEPVVEGRITEIAREAE